MIHNKYFANVDFLVDKRKEKNITISEMADRCGVSRQMIHDFESKKKTSYRLFIDYLYLLVDKHQVADLLEKWGE